MSDYKTQITEITPCLVCNEFHAGATEDYKGHLHKNQQGVEYVRLLLIGGKSEFCWRCSCVKSGWANVQNEISGHCADVNCVCHTAERAS